MNIFKRLAFKMAKGYILDKIQSKDFKAHLIRFIVHRIDIPRLTIVQERNLYAAIIDAICAFLKKEK